jgi:hypothetical protein
MDTVEHIHNKLIESKVLTELEEKREQVYTIINKVLSSPSNRSRNSLNKEFSMKGGDYDLINKVFEGKNNFDFIPTQKEYLMNMLETIASRKVESFLEPCCGLGNVIHEVLKVNPYIQITAYELNPEFLKILKILFPPLYYPNITFHSKNFLKSDEKGNYPVIFCNPPFTDRNDKRYYINFFYKCQEISLNSKTDYYENIVYFISPRLYETLKKNTYIDPSLILISSYLNKQRIKDILSKDITNKDFQEFKKEKFYTKIFNELEHFEPLQIKFIQNVKFIGTTFNAFSYEIVNSAQ